MRTHDEVAAIKQRISDPYSIDNFLTPAEVVHLIGLYEVGNKTEKNTGPITVDLPLEDVVVEEILDRLAPVIGPFDITAALFFSTDTPHIIHNDDTFVLPPTVGKAITLPLQMEGYAGGPLPKLCFFDQFYFHGPAKFFGGDENVPTFYNRCVYDYADVDGVTDEPFLFKRLVPHLKDSWLKGLSLHSFLDWKPTSALVFDSVRLHCASDFRQLGITRKLGLSIFTKRQ